MPIPPSRYVELIRATLRAAVKDRGAREDSFSLAISFVAKAAGAAPPPSDSIDSQTLLDGRIVDGAGHSRPLYRGLLIYALAHSEARIGKLAEVFATSRRDAFASFADARSPVLASNGSAIIELAFDALAASCVAESVSSDPAAGVLMHIASSQQSDGSYLARTSSDNPEPTWYYELALLHAMASFAYRRDDSTARASAMRAARYQAEQIQPDHASSHPFAMHAFLRDEQGTYLADMMLHAAGVQQPSRMDTVSLLLLADAVDCIRSCDWRE